MSEGGWGDVDGEDDVRCGRLCGDAGVPSMSRELIGILSVALLERAQGGGLHRRGRPDRQGAAEGGGG